MHVVHARDTCGRPNIVPDRRLLCTLRQAVLAKLFTRWTQKVP